MLEGTTLSKGDVEELSKSPSREELIGQIAGLLLAPGANLAAALLGPGGKLAGQVEAIADGEGAADETTVDESAEEAGAEEAEEAGAEEAEEAGAEEADSGDDAEAATETESEESDA
ncbi:MAG: hypothetical protein CM1200mP2_00290 [Planctomycetaceae bacterium]|nr:MAG: hypothetical protein CM1200mP2_00290 [Planctomycetaceae bacterium]